MRLRVRSGRPAVCTGPDWAGTCKDSVVGPRLLGSRGLFWWESKLPLNQSPGKSFGNCCVTILTSGQWRVQDHWCGLTYRVQPGCHGPVS